jgi:hypothetical protein
MKVNWYNADNKVKIYDKCDKSIKSDEYILVAFRWLYVILLNPFGIIRYAELE